MARRSARTTAATCRLTKLGSLSNESDHPFRLNTCGNKDDNQGGQNEAGRTRDWAFCRGSYRGGGDILLHRTNSVSDYLARVGHVYHRRGRCEVALLRLYLPV